MSYRAAHGSHVVPHDLLFSIDHHLRRVDAIKGKPGAIFLLPLIHLLQRERIAPSQLVPIRDVFAEDDRLRAGNELGRVQPREKGVSRGAIGAAFRGEEFYQHRLPMIECGARGRLAGC